MKTPTVSLSMLLVLGLALTQSKTYGQKPQDDAPKVKVATVQKRDVTITQQYVCSLQSHRHIEVRTPADWYVSAIAIKQGQAVKRDDLLFQIRPLADEDKVVSIKAPFDGLVGRFPRQQGSLVLKGETLTTLSDNSVLQAEFEVDEGRYLEHISRPYKEDPRIELVLANGDKFPQPGKLGAIAAEFNASHREITFRADFSNPERLLRHGQTGTVLVSNVWHEAIVVPERATREVLDKRYVYLVDQDGVVQQREIVVENESEDLFVIKRGVGVGDKVVVDGVRLVRVGEKVKY